MISKLIGFMDFKDKRIFATSIMVSVLTIFSSTALLGLSAYLIAFCGTMPDISEIMVAVVGVRFFGILRALLRYYERLITHESTFRLIGKIRQSLLKGLSKKSFDELEAMDKKDVLIKLVDDTERLQDFYLRTFQPMATSLLCGIAGLIIFGSILNSTSVLIFGIAYFGAVILWPVISMLTTRKQIDSVLQRKAKEKALLMEYFSNYVDISCNSAEKRWDDLLEDNWKESQVAEHKIDLISSLTNGLNIIFINSALAGILFMSYRLFALGQIHLLLIPVFALFTPALFEGTNSLTSFYEKFEKSRISASRVFGIVNDKSVGTEMLDNNGKLDKKGNYESKEILESKEIFETNEISGKNIGYSVNGIDILDGIDFEFGSGKRIAVVGPSGAGKTTLGKLIIGVIQPTKGEIKKVVQDPCFSVVNQNVFLFNTTIRNNLFIGDSKASEEEIVNALKIVGAWEFISELPDGLNTELGENGIRFSGGQRQRIAIARALLHKKPFLFFDEATSGLDISSEKAILNNILSEYRDKGILVVTHRFSHMEAYDEIIVLNKGRIEARGTHETLINGENWYSKIQNKLRKHLN